LNSDNFAIGITVVDKENQPIAVKDEDHILYIPELSHCTRKIILKDGLAKVTKECEFISLVKCN
jgi:hypothetical protein